MFGLLNIHKPAGLTSRDVVNQVQRLIRPVKVGHAGTLDPLATGVLVLCLGKATRLIPYVQRMKKRYCGTFQLGRSSETEDVEGTITELQNPVEPTIEQIESTIPKFVGEIQQRPPAYSALKVKGRRAYQLAREGNAPELKPRPITIHRLELVRYTYPELVLDLECGSGTYVRSLGRDLAQAMGTEAVMSALVRTGIGAFAVDSAVELRQITKEALSQQVLHPKLAVTELPHVELGGEALRRIQHGQFISLGESALAETSTPSSEFAAFSENGDLVAILTPRDTGQWGASRNFAI